MKGRKVVVLTIIMTLFWHLSLLGASDSNQLKNQDIIRKIQYNKTKAEKERQAVEKQLQEKRNQNSTQGSAVKLTDKDINQGGAKFFIDKIILINSRTLSNKTKLKLIKPYVNQEMSLGDIQKLVGDITNEYISRGYVASRVTIPIDQNLKSGEVKLLIYEGRLGKIVVNDGVSLRDKIKAFLSIPAKKGEPIRSEDVEQGAKQFNEVSTNEAVVDIIPGENPGESDLHVKNKARSIGDFNVTLSNGAGADKGEYTAGLSYDTGNILGINDKWYLNGNVAQRTPKDYSRSTYINLSLPFRNMTFSGGLNYSNNSDEIIGVYETYVSKTTTLTKSFSADWLVYNSNKNGKVNLKSELSVSSPEYYIDDTFVEVSSRNTGSLKNSISYSGELLKGYLSVDTWHQMGLTGIFNIPKDEGSTLNLKPGEQIPIRDYHKYGINLRWFKNLTIGQQRFSYEFSASGEYSTDWLYSENKFSVGDNYSVRGFEYGIQGEKGIHIRNEVGYNLPRTEMFLLSLIGGSQIKLGYDIGQTMAYENVLYSEYDNKETISSYTISLNKGLGDGSIEASYSMPISAPSYIEKGSGVFSVKLAYSF